MVWTLFWKLVLAWEREARAKGSLLGRDRKCQRAGGGAASWAGFWHPGASWAGFSLSGRAKRFLEGPEAEMVDFSIGL